MHMPLLQVMSWTLTAIFVVAQQLLLLDDLEIMAISSRLRKVCLFAIYLIGIIEMINSRTNWY